MQEFTENTPKTPESLRQSLSPEKKEWLLNQFAELRGGHDPETPLNDLEKVELKKLIGDSTVIALGEATHGSSEIFQMKHRIFRHLVEEYGFKNFAMEASMAAAEAVNDYVLLGKGTAKDSIAGMGFWTWMNQEVVNLVEWMRNYNQCQVEDSKKLQFFGFDCQSIDDPLKKLTEFITDSASANAEIKKLALESLSRIPKECEFYRIKEQLFTAYQEGRSDIEKIQLNEAFAELARITKESISAVREICKVEMSFSQNKSVFRYLNLLDQVLGVMTTDGFSSTPGGFSSIYEVRDRFMAQNIDEIIEETGDAKIFIWAHNEHIKKSAITLDERASLIISAGHHLSNKYGDKFCSIGFVFYEGQATGKKDEVGPVETLDVLSPEMGSIEHDLKLFYSQQNCQGAGLVNIRGASENVFPWNNGVKMNLLGAVLYPTRDWTYYPVDLKDRFDGLIFIPVSSGSKYFKLD